jgi:phospholipid/cholesterol/gamma-HCH transport system ATP-binding protein
MVGQGKLIASGSPDALSASSDPYVRQFLDAKPDGPIAFTYPETTRFKEWLASRSRGRT